MVVMTRAAAAAAAAAARQAASAATIQGSSLSPAPHDSATGIRTCRGDGYIAIISPSHTGMGVHTKWVYDDNADSLLSPTGGRPSLDFPPPSRSRLVPGIKSRRRALPSISSLSFCSSAGTFSLSDLTEDNGDDEDEDEEYDEDENDDMSDVSFEQRNRGTSVPESEYPRLTTPGVPQQSVMPSSVLRTPRKVPRLSYEDDGAGHIFRMGSLTPTGPTTASAPSSTDHWRVFSSKKRPLAREDTMDFDTGEQSWIPPVRRGILPVTKIRMSSPSPRKPRMLGPEGTHLILEQDVESGSQYTCTSNSHSTTNSSANSTSSASSFVPSVQYPAGRTAVVFKKPRLLGPHGTHIIDPDSEMET